MSITSMGSAVNASMEMKQGSLAAGVSTSMQKKSLDFQESIIADLMAPADMQMRDQAMQKSGKGQKLNISV